MHVCGPTPTQLRNSGPTVTSSTLEPSSDRSHAPPRSKNGSNTAATVSTPTPGARNPVRGPQGGRGTPPEPALTSALDVQPH